jgi:flavin-dependent dehydrogenase
VNFKRACEPLVILGAGPAGCAAAIKASGAGLRPLVLHVAAGSGRVPGETLHPGIEPVLKQLGVWEAVDACGFPRHEGLWRESEDGARSFTAYGRDESGPWRGFHVDRSVFHRILRRRAMEVGAEFVSVRALGYYDPYRRLVVADGIARQARWLLDATGRRAWLATQMALRPEYAGRPQKIRFGWTEDTGETDGNPLLKQRKGGWDWSARVAPGMSAWVSLRRGSEARGSDATCRLYREAAGDGWFLLGDAGCLIDPAGANGVLRAMMSGIMAVHLLAGVRGRMLGGETAAGEYRMWLGALFHATTSTLAGG